MVPYFSRSVIIAACAATLLVTAAAGAAGREPVAIAGVIERHRGEITQIYNTYLNAGLDIKGTVVVRFTIAATGAVTRTEVAEGTTGVKLFEEAVAAAVARWDFGPSDGDAVTVLYPFSFEVQESGD